MILAAAGFAPGEHARAMLNILEDFASEKVRLQDAQRAVLNILEDAASEQLRLERTERAVLNILEDLATEKERLERTQEEVARSADIVRASLHEKEVLLKEVHHRVKNNLQVVSSLLNLQARYLADPEARAIFLKSRDRVQSIALVHERLYQAADLSHIDFAEYVLVLVDNLCHAHDATGRGIAWEFALGETRLAIDQAIPCGLLINELVTNCLKHAFRDREAGLVRVALRRPGPGLIELEVGDDGVGLPADLDPRATSSIGLDLVFTFAGQIDAHVDIERDGGTRFRVAFATGRAP